MSLSIRISTLLPLLLGALLLPNVSLSAKESKPEKPNAGKEKKKPEVPEHEQRKLMEHARGTFDLSKNARPYQVCLIMDQEGNRYPSFWCGRNVAGKIMFYADIDMLEGTLRFQQKGDFTLQITNAAHKKGMFERLPCGSWVENLGQGSFEIKIDQVNNAVFKEAKLTKIVTGKGISGDTMMVIFDATIGGELRFDRKSARFNGPGQISFLGDTPAFTLKSTFPLPGSKLGLIGPEGQGITVTFYTASMPSLEVPKLDAEGGEDSVGLEDELP